MQSILEFAYSVWYPTFQIYISVLKNVQRHDTKFPFNRIRLEMFGLLLLAFWCRREDITTFNSLSEDSVLQLLLTLDHLRWHLQKLRRENFRITVRLNFLVNRVVYNWNSLPEDVVMAVFSSVVFKSGSWNEYSLKTWYVYIY